MSNVEAGCVAEVQGAKWQGLTRLEDNSSQSLHSIDDGETEGKEHRAGEGAPV